MSVKVVTASASLIMMSIVAVEANQGKFDTRVQKAATDIAAAQLGSMRGPIDYDEVPVIVKSKPTIKSKVESEIFQRPAWMPESEDNKLPPITNHVDGVDSMATGSIKNRQQPRALPELWDRFDESGNPVDRYGNRIELPPITNHVDGVDNTATGSIEKQRQPRALPELWDRFDESGNPVDRYGNRID